MSKINYKKGFGPLMILLVIVVIIALGGGIYYSSHNSAPSDATTVDSSANANVSVKSESSSGTLRDLLALGKDLMCTIDQSTASTTVTGTMYISGNMMSGDFTTGSSGSIGTVSHMIRNGDTFYAWNGAMGAKMMMSSLSATSSTHSKSNVNLDQKVDYKCSSWTVDSSKFTPPNNIKFTDVSAMMKTNTTAGASVSAQCSACNALSGTSKTQCLAALHC